ncbi:MAG: ABC transporter permease [Acholeplasmataceae bacterium]|nr:MAG: ABC transporter permease [Acholeplasmataceae bacterium]
MKKVKTWLLKVWQGFKTAMPKVRQAFRRGLTRAFIKIQPSLIAVAVGLFAGIIVMLIFNPERAIWGFSRLLMGGFSFGIRGFSAMLHHSTAIIFTGLAVVFAFRTGLFNIGASGQMMVAAYVTAHIGILWNIPAPWHWMVAIFFACLAGMVWGLIPGLLKAYRNVHEVVSSIMLNWIAANLVVYLIIQNIWNEFTQGASRNIQRSAQIPHLFRGFLGATSQLTIGFLFAVALGIIVHIVLYKTTLGFQLRASGFSMEGSKYAGMNTKRNVVLSMGISGAIAGMAGGVLYTNYGKTIPTTIALFMEGFEGISVALLGLGEPIGAIIAGIFLSHIKQGGVFMQPHFVPEIANIIIGVIIYTTAISVSLQLIFRRYRKDFAAWRAARKEKKQGEVSS